MFDVTNWVAWLNGEDGPRGTPSRETLSFLCQLTCQSADIMSSLCGVGVRVRVNNFFSKTTRPRDMLFFTPQPLMAVGVLFSPMVSGWAGGRAGGRLGGRREIVCPGCISETVRCRKLILGRDIG